MHEKDKDKQFEYPTIKDLYPLNKTVDVDKIRETVKKLRRNHKENVIWSKYDVTLTDYLNKDLKSEGLSDTVTKVLTYTYPFHNNKRKLTFLKKFRLFKLFSVLLAKISLNGSPSSNSNWFLITFS